MNILRNALTHVYEKKTYPNHWDVIAFFAVITLILLLAHVAKQMNTPYHLGQTLPLSLDPHALPGYALRTVLRMLIALVFSLLFTFIFATLAAKINVQKQLSFLVLIFCNPCQF